MEKRIARGIIAAMAGAGLLFICGFVFVWFKPPVDLFVAQNCRHACDKWAELIRRTVGFSGDMNSAVTQSDGDFHCGCAIGMSVPFEPYHTNQPDAKANPRMYMYGGEGLTIGPNNNLNLTDNGKVLIFDVDPSKENFYILHSPKEAK